MLGPLHTFGNQLKRDQDNRFREEWNKSNFWPDCSCILKHWSNGSKILDLQYWWLPRPDSRIFYPPTGRKYLHSCSTGVEEISNLDLQKFNTIKCAKTTVSSPYCNLNLHSDNKCTKTKIVDIILTEKNNEKEFGFTRVLPISHGWCNFAFHLDQNKKTTKRDDVKIYFRT